MPNLAEHIEVHTYADGGAAVAGERIDTTGFPDPYTATLAHVAAEAERRRSKVLTHGIDHAAEQDSWFFVTPDGDIELTRSGADGMDGDHAETSGAFVTADAAQPASVSDAPAVDRSHVAEAPAPPAAPPRIGTAAAEPTPDNRLTVAVNSEAPGPQATASQSAQASSMRPAEQTQQADQPRPAEQAQSAQASSRRPAEQTQPAEQTRPAERPPQSSATPAAGPIVSQHAPGFTPRSEAPAQPRSRREAKLGNAGSSLQPDTAVFVRPPKSRPTHGARGALYKLSGGAVNLGPGGREQYESGLAARIARPLTGSHNTAILSLKGGIGKTSTTVGLGLMLAEYRGDPPMAIDANPDSGDLAERALGESGYLSSPMKTISDVLDNIDSIDSLTELSRYVQHAGRFHLIAGEQDPALSDSLTTDEYLAISRLISRYYSVVLTDCGTGVTHPGMSGILQTADNLIVAAGYAVSGANRARNTLRWLAGHGYEELARNAIVVITDKDGVSSRVDKETIRSHLAGYCRELIAVPNDKGVADGDLVSLDGLKAATRDAYRRLAAAVVDGYN